LPVFLVSFLAQVPSVQILWNQGKGHSEIYHIEPPKLLLCQALFRPLIFDIFNGVFAQLVQNVIEGHYIHGRKDPRPRLVISLPKIHFTK